MMVQHAGDLGITYIDTCAITGYIRDIKIYICICKDTYIGTMNVHVYTHIRVY